MNKVVSRILRVVILLNIAIIFSYATYAWFSDKTNPTITQKDIKVTSAEGLVIKLSPDSEARTVVGLNEILSDFNTFSLKQMSSVDGINFYTIDFGAGLAHSAPEFVKIPVQSNGLINQDENGIIDYNFYLATEDQAKHVYLHRDTRFLGLASNSIRLAITFDVGNEKRVYIFGDTRENGIDGYTTKAVNRTGTFSYNNIDPSYVSNQLVYKYEDYDGGRGESDEDPIDLTKTLFTMEANSVMLINVKIWLEGGDIDCDTTLSDTYIDALIKFGSANVLRDAPVLSANNSTRTITGLTSEMEYAYTNNSTTTWTSVTNPNMTFDRGTTVYVRYKEVIGVSTYSYATKVAFN